jgi:hypothetical protein
VSEEAERLKGESDHVADVTGVVGAVSVRRDLPRQKNDIARRGKDLMGRSRVRGREREERSSTCIGSPRSGLFKSNSSERLQSPPVVGEGYGGSVTRVKSLGIPSSFCRAACHRLSRDCQETHKGCQ